MAQVRLAKVDEIPAGTMKSFEVEGKEVLVVNAGGRFYAIGNRCTHAGGDLSKGKLEGTTVTCPRHGSKFDVISGSRLAGPAKQNEPVYTVTRDGQDIVVTI